MLVEFRSIEVLDLLAFDECFVLFNENSVHSWRLTNVVHDEEFEGSSRGRVLVSYDVLDVVPELVEIVSHKGFQLKGVSRRGLDLGKSVEGLGLLDQIEKLVSVEGELLKLELLFSILILKENLGVSVDFEDLGLEDLVQEVLPEIHHRFKDKMDFSLHFVSFNSHPYIVCLEDLHVIQEKGKKQFPSVVREFLHLLECEGIQFVGGGVVVEELITIQVSEG